MNINIEARRTKVKYMLYHAGGFGFFFGFMIISYMLNNINGLLCSTFGLTYSTYNLTRLYFDRPQYLKREK